MTRFKVAPGPSSGDSRRPDRSNLLLAVAVLAGVLVLGGLSLGVHGSGGSPASVPLGPSSTPSPARLAVTHPFAVNGDLTVPSGNTTIIAPLSGNQTYYEGGNINVLAGGHLVVRNTTLVFVQFIGNSGTLANRLSHVYHLVDNGSVVLVNSSITTAVNLLDPYPLLSLSVNGPAGSFQLTNGSLAFPGSISVNGTGASFWVDRAEITGNPDVVQMLSAASGNPAELEFANASLYAPMISVTGGARATFLDSVENHTFRSPVVPTEPLGLRPNAATTTLAPMTSGGPAQSLAFAAPSNQPDALALAAFFDHVQGVNVTLSYTQGGSYADSNDSQFLFGGAWTLPEIV
ncbi:MAG TPA: hypothetical protein VLY85_02760, partial [Thermoplasmata archaeon]|nr:hypothetical protein [Thermoplasmata archaeon]